MQQRKALLGRGLAQREGGGTAVATGAEQNHIPPCIYSFWNQRLPSLRDKHRRQPAGIGKYRYLNFLVGKLTHRHAGIYSKATT